MPQSTQFDLLFTDAPPAATPPASQPASSAFSHARFAPRGQEGYELSSHGDKRFSALYARMADGRSIEEAYQLDVKGYRGQGNDWRLGKGKPALDGKNHDALWVEYLALWRQWAAENPALIKDLSNRAEGKMLTDKFASSPISQARALAQILNEAVDAVAVSEEAPRAQPAIPRTRR